MYGTDGTVTTSPERLADALTAIRVELMIPSPGQLERIAAIAFDPAL